MKNYIVHVAVALLLIFLLAAPSMVPPYYLGLLILTLIYGIFAMSLDILTGYTGLPSLGHAMFFGVSAYTVGILNVKVFHNFGWELMSGLLAAGIIASAFGLLTVRNRGVYFLMITLALSMVLWGLASNWGALTGGHDGLPGISRPKLGPIPWDLEVTSNYYYFVLIFFVIAVLFMFLIVRSPFGVALRGIRESETRMSVLGYHVWLYKYISFVVTGLFAGLAGILFAYYTGFAHPSILHIGTSAKVLFMFILGGPGTLFGPLLGAGMIVFLENLISAYSERWQIFLGAIYVLVVVCAPRGIYGPTRQLLRRLLSWDLSS
jgi:branched-chain amino acid transport system permease protein